MRVADMDEERLLAQIVPHLPTGPRTLTGPGDDAAVLRHEGTALVITTDVLVQDRHFRLDWGSGADVGWRAVMQNLADVAAMGARPTEIVVALVLPPHLEVTWVTDLARGLAQACAQHGAGVVGGDLAGGDQVIVSVTATGVLEDTAVRRCGARPGDVLAVSGTLGRARAGWHLVQHGAHEPEDLVRAFLRPSPPVGDGPVAAAAGAHAMMDLSDGLIRDATRMAQASGVTLRIEGARLQPDVAALAGVAGARAMEWVLGGGEDHGLLAAFDPGTPLPGGFRAIGSVGEPGDARHPVLVDGAEPPPNTRGWDHFGG